MTGIRAAQNRRTLQKVATWIGGHVNGIDRVPGTNVYCVPNLVPHTLSAEVLTGFLRLRSNTGHGARGIAMRVGFDC